MAWRAMPNAGLHHALPYTELTLTTNVSTCKQIYSTFATANSCISGVISHSQHQLAHQVRTQRQGLPRTVAGVLSRPADGPLSLHGYVCHMMYIICEKQ